MSYGFTIKAEQNVVTTMRQIEQSMRGMSNTVAATTKDAEKRMEQMGETARRIGRYIAEAFAVREIVHYGEELLRLTAEFEGFQNVIKFSSKNSYDAAQNLSFIEDVVKRLHLPLKEAMQGFSEMQAGLIGTGVEGENLRKVFEGISTAGAVLHLPAKNLEMILYDFKEIGERGLNMRNWMSLQGWFPGIGNVVRQTFGKSFHEIEELKGTKDEITPGEFLTKLGSGMSKFFAGGVPNAGNALISQMNDTKNAITKTWLEIGDNLRPVFVEIMQQIRSAFDSAPIKAFINNVKPIAETLLTLAKIWVTYKVAVTAAQIVTVAFTRAQTVLQEAMALSGLGMTKMQFLLSELGGIPASAIFGGFAVAIGYVVSQIIDFNNEVEKSIENFSHLKEMQSGQDYLTKEYNRITNFYRNRASHSQEEQQMNLADVNAVLPQLQKTYGVISDQFKASSDSLARLKGPQPQSFFSIGKETPFEDQIAGQKQLADSTKSMIKTLEDIQKSYEKDKVSPYKPLMPNPDSKTKEASLHTMGLAGAKGGLGEAKTVTIHIGTLQRVDVKTPAAIKTAAQDGVEVLLRALNNMAYGRSATM